MVHVEKLACCTFTLLAIFPPDYIPTVFDSYAKLTLYHTTPVKLNLWDTAGQEDWARIRTAGYNDTGVFLLLFSVGSRSSYQNVRAKWIQELRHFCPKTPIVLCAAQIDRREDPAQAGDCVTREEGEKMAKEVGCFSYTEFSALKNVGVTELFNEGLRAYFYKPPAPPPPRSSFCVVL
eukprot:TRINITY_DN4519_c0_g3_i2.p1 TRINITY_DN4519_c0_g3~~TRINITY_DN4519_c0_g3_i2.p1  ORF type:complete len:178 (-),score=39.96 TRINITY_DN4519_c0_g3_i2:211-744(-)